MFQYKTDTLTKNDINNVTFLSVIISNYCVFDLNYLCHAQYPLLVFDKATIHYGVYNTVFYLPDRTLTNSIYYAGQMSILVIMTQRAPILNHNTKTGTDWKQMQRNKSRGEIFLQN